MLLRLRTTLKEFLVSWVARFYKVVPIFGKGICRKPRERKVIISLTSYPQRFPTLYLVVKSLMLQSVKADKIILYLGEDSRGVKLPETLTRLCGKGLEIEYRDGNLRSHKKYYYVMQEYPEDIVILADDDILYDPRLVQRLLASYARYPQAVSANRVHRITKNPDGSTARYTHWECGCETCLAPELDLFFMTGFGTLFPPHCLDSRTFDADCFMRECEAADDIWLNFMRLLKDIPTVFAPGSRRIILRGTQTTSLSADNVWGNGNDRAVQNMERATGIRLGDFCTLEYTEDAAYARWER